MPISIDIDGLERLESEWADGVDELYSDAAKAVDNALDAGEEHAKTAHAYKDRNRNLTNSIGSRLTALSATTIEGVIEAGGEKAPYAIYVEDGTRPHPIDAKKGKWLAWENPEAQGDWHFAKHVDHPGTAPTLFMKFAFEKATLVLDDRLSRAVDRFVARMNR